jgi:pimeloyl-ACP methyl ester carboxylesterase
MSDLSLNRRVDTRVGTLALADLGEGLPLVLWPSLFSDHRLYAPVVEQLGAGWRTLVVDGPGFGESARPYGDVQPEMYADALVDLLDALQLEAAIFAGCSWGGQIAAHAGARWPERVHGVLMMNTPIEESLGGHGIEVFGARWIGSTKFWGNGVARSMFAKTTLNRYPERVRAFVEAFPAFDREAAATTARTVLTRFRGLAGVLPKIKAPTSILLGAEDNLYPVERMLASARLASNATIEVLPECGHLAPLEAPGAVVRALDALVPARLASPSIVGALS